MSGYRAIPIVDSQGRAIAASAPITPEQLAAASRAEMQRIAKAVADREANEAAALAEQERRAAEQGRAELEAYRERARAAWLGSGGDAAEFSDAWPELKRRHLSQRAEEELTARERMIEQAKAEMRASGRYERF